MIEKNAIALLSNHLSPSDVPSEKWLGHHSPRQEIRASGLWNLNYVADDHDPAFISILERSVELTCKGHFSGEALSDGDGLRGD